MSLDLQDLPFDARTRYADIGRQFGCRDALAQAQQTLAAHAQLADAIAEHGFVEEDAQRLREAAQLLNARIEDAVERSCPWRTATPLPYVEAMREGKAARQRARSILFIVVQRLAYSGDPLEAEAARAVAATLQKTESSRGDPVRLAHQLEQLRAALSMPRVIHAVEARGGPATMAQLSQAAERLRAESAAKDDAPQGPEPPATDELDLLCGIIVELVRDVRRAARSAARALSRPGVASAFELLKLYGPLGGGAAESERVPPIR